MGFTASVTRIADGDNVDAATLNTPIVQLNDNDTYLKALVDAINAGLSSVTGGESLTKAGVAFKSSVVAGNAVYWSSANSRYEEALAGSTAANNFVGFCLSKTTSTSGYIVFAGLTTLAPTLAGVETIAAGTYWLSDSEAGKITATRPTSGRARAVAIADGSGKLVVVNYARESTTAGAASTGSTTDSYATLVDTGSVSKGLLFSATLRNTDSADSLTYQLTVTDMLGASDSVEEEIPAGCVAVFSCLDSIGDLYPPYRQFLLEAKSTSAGNAADYSLTWMKTTDA